jgi:sulfur transfer complex TusBCD TusB component (DsrH family)
MQDYLLFESRDPLESADVPRHFDLAASLAKEGGRVALYLVQNGVLAARHSGRSQALTRLVEAGVEVLADDFSLRERGIAPSVLPPGIRSSPIDLALDRLAEGRKALWF